MNAAQMLAAAGEPNTTAGRAKFHQRFPSKAAFDAWYNSKKEYGGGLTDGIAFPQQPMASYAYGGVSDKQFFAPNYKPFNGPIGFYGNGGMTDEIAFPQQPTEHINFSAFPWQPKYDMGGLPGGSNDMPCLECGGNMAYGGYMQPGGPVGYKPAPNPDTYFNEQDAALNYPAQGTNINYDYSKVTDSNRSLLNNYTADELNRMGANLPVANPVQDARFKKINDYNKEHPIIPAGGGLFKYSSPKSGQEGQRLQYANGKYQLYTPPPNPVVVNKYGGYMQTGGTTEMDQGQYTNGMAQEYLKSLADFNMSAQPMPMGNVQEAGYANYGTEVNNNFNTLDMNAVDQMSSMQDRIDALKNKQTSIFDLGRNITNIGSSIYQKPMSYKTKTVGSGMMGPAASPAGTSNNWADTRSNMAAKQAAGNMFKEYGGDFFQNGGSENKMNYQNRVQDILMKGQARPTFGQSSAQSYKGNAAQAAANTQGSSGQQTQQQYTPDQIAAFQSMMQNYFNQNAYAPSYQAYNPKGQFAMSPFLNNSALKDIAWKGYGRKGKATFRTVYDPSTGKTVQIPTDESKQARNYDSRKTGEEAKGPGFIKNLIAKNKQRKADKQRQIPLTQQEKEMRPDYNSQKQKTPAELAAEQAQLDYERSADKQWNENMQNSDVYDTQHQQEADAFWNQNLQNAAQAKRNYGKTFPDPSNFSSYAPANNRPMVNPINNPVNFPTWQSQNLQKAPYTPGSAGPGFAYGGFPEYEEGAELDMSPEEIANYLAMGGTLEYLD